jgi:hypothetical protein
MAKRARAVAAPFRIANFENQLHVIRIPEAEMDRSPREMAR